MEKNCKVCGEETTPVNIEGKDYYSTICMDCLIEVRNKNKG